MMQPPIGGGQSSGKGPQHWPARQAKGGLAEGEQPTVQLQEHRASSDLAPPTWAGDSPEKNLRHYLKAAEAWSRVTRVPPTQRGLSLMASATGRL